MNYSFNTILHINNQDSKFHVTANSFIENSFKETGVSVLSAHTFQECKITLETKIPDVILQDSHLLDKKTKNLTANIFEEWPEIPVILLSAMKTDQNKQVTLEKSNNMIGLINLPCSSSELSKNIDYILLTNKRKSKHKRTLRLDKLKLKYQKHLIDIKPSLEIMWHNIFSEKKTCKESIQKLIQESHKIAGTAGTYGLQEISKSAADLEDYLIQFEDNNLSELNHLITEGEVAFKKIRHLINQLT